jgi:hypothetical protein
MCVYDFTFFMSILFKKVYRIEPLKNIHLFCLVFEICYKVQYIDYRLYYSQFCVTFR